MGPCARSRSESPSRAGSPAPACAFSPRARWASATRHLAAVAAVLIQADARSFVGRGAGLSDARSRASATWSSALSTRTRLIPPTDRRALEGGRLRHRGDVRLLPGGRGLEGADAPRRGHILHGGPVRGAPVPQRLGLPRGHPRIKRTRKPGAPSRARYKGTPRRRHALGRARAPWRICPFWIRRCACTGWEDVHGDWHGAYEHFEAGK